jgi:hypothetical protein
VNNTDILDLLLEGATATKPGKGRLFNNQNAFANLTVGEVHTTCAMGAIRYALSIRFGCTFIDLTNHPSLNHFMRDYGIRYGTSLVEDNDNFGRDFVIRRAKEMVNEKEASL